MGLLDKASRGRSKPASVRAGGLLERASKSRTVPEEKKN